MMKDEQYSPEVLIDFLYKRLSDEKTTEINDWLNADPVNQAYFQELVDTWFVSGNLANERLDTEIMARKEGVRDNVWKHIKASTNEEVTVAFTPFYRRTWFQVAASVAIIFAIGWWGKNKLEPQVQQLSAIESMEGQVPLSDGSKVQLNKNSHLTFSTGPLTTNRTISLAGEAYFDVAKEDKPFVIQTHDAEVTVLGTAFGVKAYADAPTEVFVERGRVSVRFLAGDSLIMLNAGEFVYGRKSIDSRKPGTEQKISRSSLMVQNHLFWKTKKLAFNDTPLVEALEVLEGHYGVNIQVKNKAVLNCGITAEFDESSLETVLNVLERLYQLKIKKISKGYELDGEGC
ncbi:MAG: FecR domain-containing protein [Bacteroidota bacterium]